MLILQPFKEDLPAPHPPTPDQTLPISEVFGPPKLSVIISMPQIQKLSPRTVMAMATGPQARRGGTVQGFERGPGSLPTLPTLPNGLICMGLGV